MREKLFLYSSVDSAQWDVRKNMFVKLLFHCLRFFLLILARINKKYGTSTSVMEQELIRNTEQQLP